MEHGYRQLAYWLLALPLIVVAGFWIPYLSEIPHFEPSITAAVHLHAGLLFAWVGLLVIQPLAIRYKALSVHRILGKASVVLMPLILLSAAAMLRKEYQEHLADGSSAAEARIDEYLSACQLALFAALYGLSLMRIRRRDIAGHMRYMICIALVLLPAGLARTLGYWFNVSQRSSQSICFALIDLSLIALIVFDRRRRRGPGGRRASARPYVVASAAYIVIEVGWLALGRPV